MIHVFWLSVLFTRAKEMLSFNKQNLNLIHDLQDKKKEKRKYIVINKDKQ